MVSKYFGNLVVFCVFGMFAALGATDLAAQVRPWTPLQETVPVVHGRGFVPPTEEEFRAKLKVYSEKRDLPSNFSWVDQGASRTSRTRARAGRAGRFRPRRRSNRTCSSNTAWR